MAQDKAIEEINKRFRTEYSYQISKKKRLEILASLITESEGNGLSAYATCFKGYVEWLNKKYDSAISLFNEAIGSDPDIIYSYNGLGKEVDPIGWTVLGLT